MAAGRNYLRPITIPLAIPMKGLRDIRNRIGFAPNEHWLFYTTGGGIRCGIGRIRSSDHTSCWYRKGFRSIVRRTTSTWVGVVGGGMAYAINCHWSVKAEYLYYNLDERFHAVALSNRG